MIALTLRAVLASIGVLVLYTAAVWALLAGDRCYYRLRYGRAWLDDFDRRMSEADDASRRPVPVVPIDRARKRAQRRRHGGAA